LRIPEALAQALDAEASKRMVSRNLLVEKAIERFLGVKN
jgi:predicted HicB family RNase H-like nuclease